MKFLSINKIAFIFSISILPFIGIAQNKSFKVTLDAGHGGKDFGAVYSGHVEKNIALAVTLKVGKILESQSGVNVNYTRKTDVFIDLIERANIANKIDANIFVSIHCNANKNTEADGTETYVMGMTKNASSLAVAKSENSVVTLEKDYKEKYEGYDPNSPETMIGLTLMQEEFMENSISLASKIEDAFSNLGKKIRGGGVKQAPYMVLHKSYMPRVLIEMGFISNPTEGSILDSEEGQDEIAKAIASAIMKYKKEYFGGNALAEEIKPSKFLSEKSKSEKTEKTEKTEKVETAESTKKETKESSKSDKAVVKEVAKDKKADSLVVSKEAEVEAAKKAKIEATKLAKEKALKDKAEKEAAVAEAKRLKEEAKKAKELAQEEAKKAVTAVPNKKVENKETTSTSTESKTKEEVKSVKEVAKKEVEKTVEKEVVKPFKEETKKVTEKVVEKSVEKTEAAPVKERKETNAANTLIFKVQIAASIKKLDLIPANFKGLQMISMNVEDDIYKYMYQATSNYDEAKKYLDEVKSKGYTSAFMVAFKNGEKISIQEALAK